MEIKIAILEDEKEYIEIIAENISKCCLSESFQVDGYLRSKELLNSEKKYDIVFIDVELDEETDGFEVAKKYRQKNDDGLIIIVTSHEELSPEGYKVNAFRYIFKSNMEKTMGEAIESAVKLLKDNQLIELEVIGNTFISLPVKSIAYMETEKRNVRMYVGQESYVIKGTINELKENMEKVGFVCPHRSYLVNLDWINLFDNSDIYLKNGTKIPISRIKKKEITETIIKKHFGK